MIIESQPSYDVVSLDRLVPTDPRRRADRELVDRFEPAVDCALGGAHLHLEEAHVDVDVCRSRCLHVEQALDRIVGSSPTPASTAPGGPTMPNCQRTWFFAAVDR